MSFLYLTDKPFPNIEKCRVTLNFLCLVYFLVVFCVFCCLGHTFLHNKLFHAISLLIHNFVSINLMHNFLLFFGPRRFFCIFQVPYSKTDGINRRETLSLVRKNTNPKNAPQSTCAQISRRRRCIHARFDDLGTRSQWDGRWRQSALHYLNI